MLDRSDCDALDGIIPDLHKNWLLVMDLLPRLDVLSHSDVHVTEHKINTAGYASGANHLVMVYKQRAKDLDPMIKALKDINMDDLAQKLTNSPGSTSISSRRIASAPRQNTLPSKSGTNRRQQPLRVNLPPSTHSRGSPPLPPVSIPSKPAPAAAAAKASQEVVETEMEECTVCMSATVDCVVYACGHMCMCYECANQQWRTKGECPICRNRIRDVIRTYRP